MDGIAGRSPLLPVTFTVDAFQAKLMPALELVDLSPAILPAAHDADLLGQFG